MTSGLFPPGGRAQAAIQLPATFNCDVPATFNAVSGDTWNADRCGSQLPDCRRQL